MNQDLILTGIKNNLILFLIKYTKTFFLSILLFKYIYSKIY
jgi:hypothetical protein